MHTPRVIIASDRSDSGKTLISAGLMKALSKKLRVRGFKAGPDFIDPGYHKLATNFPSINLDLFIMGKDNILKSLCRYSKNFDISIIEGVMGLYDGINTEYSTYELSKITKSPIILVINCYNLSSTVGAIIKGLIEYKKANIKGVILNKIASQTHFSYCKNSIEGVKVLGYVPFSKDLQVPSRHLGLFTIESYKQAEKIIDNIANLIEEYIDLDSLLQIANNADELDCNEKDYVTKYEKKTAAIAYDAAFNFYYQENIDRLNTTYNVKFFSPLNNEKIENADFIYIGGGYPELYLNELETSSTTNWLKKEAEKGIPILGECGGLMYLSKSLIDNGRKYKMIGIFDIDIDTKGKLTLGYTKLKTIKDSFISNKDEIIKGHEFHISQAIRVGEKSFLFENKQGNGIIDKKDGVSNYNTIALYSHLHFSTIEKRTVF
jgi:cobyrinic acid a,c-diamide synthase